MTGFGAAEDRVLQGRLRIEIRTVNHRYFNPQLKLPADLAGVEIEMRERLRQLLERGHVAVTVRWVEGPETDRVVTVDLVRARQVLAAAQQLKKKLKLKGTVDLAFVARQPDVLTAANGGSASDQVVQWSDVQALVERAAAEVVAMREREGKALAAELNARLDALEAAARAIEEQAPARLTAEHARLKQAVAELTTQANVDEQRLALEIALLADRVDITEELVRFRAHVAAARAALTAEQAVGKQLGFLAQELLREVNTMGSKANDARITQTVIAMKGDLEKFREQLENLE
ncbi:MAG TPA: YicC/YloC family endoribonuclease [Gemmatimonadales bacterium]|nr:YicC/YloC family endoribonuclease [Gemmatimonadales bacterium]